MASEKLSPGDLMTLEEYAERRAAFRRKIIAHKKNRTVHLGPHMTLLFEDRLLVQYQVQEMLRIERIFERAAIQDELGAYNPLIPDGGNWKATCLIEYPDVEERKRRLAELRGIEHAIWVQVGEHPKITAIADEDLPRSNEQKTSAVHFLRFDLTSAMIAALKQGAGVRVGVDHPGYSACLDVPPDVRTALAADFDDSTFHE